MTHTLTCKACSHESEVPRDPAESVYRCDQCGTFTSYGVELPRVTHQQHPEDRRFLTVRYQHSQIDVTLAMEREYARGVALDLLSVADPVVFQAFQTIAAAMLGAQSEPTGDSVATLDDPR